MLRRRLVLLTFSALLPAFAVIGYTEWNVARSRQAEVRELALRSAQHASSEIDRIMGGSESTLIAAGVSPTTRQFGAACAEYLEAVRRRIGYFTAITVANAEGRILCPASDVSIVDRGYLSRALGAKGLIVGEYTIGRVSNRPVLPVALALRDESLTESLVVIAGIDLDWLSARLRERGVPPGGSITVADRNGVIVARTPFPERFVGTRVPDEFSHLVTAEKPGTVELLSQDGTPRVLGYVPIGTDPASELYVSAGLSQEVSYASVQRAARISILIALGGALAALLAAWFVGQHAIVQPVNHLITVVNAWRRGDQKARSQLSSAGEFGQLSSALDHMMDEIERNQSERNLLIDELKHRGKNTLATVQALATASFGSDRPGKESLPDFFSRISALGRSQDVLTTGSSARNLRDVIAEATQPLTGSASGRCRIEGPAVPLTSRQVQAVTMIMHELGTNAIKYGALTSEAGKIIIRWTIEAGADAAPEVHIRWQECGGPPVHPPERRGFGTRLIRGFGQELGAVTLEYPPSGAVCEIRIVRPGIEPQNESEA